MSKRPSRQGSFSRLRSTLRKNRHENLEGEMHGGSCTSGSPRTSPAVPSAVDDVNATLSAIRCERCEWAMQCISVGCFDEAQRTSQAYDDVMTWAIAMTLCGSSDDAVRAIEAYIFAASVVLYETLMGCFNRETKTGSCQDHREWDNAVRARHSEVMHSWLLCRDSPEKLDCNTSLVSEEHQRVVILLCRLVDWSEVHRWYIVALLLRDNKEPYCAPYSSWLRYFFSLLPGGEVRRIGKGQIVLEDLGLEETLMILMSHCEDWEAHFITAICAYKLKRYRSCMSAATSMLEFSVDNNAIAATDRQLMMFVRCMAALEIGESIQAGADMAGLIACEHPYVCAVGCGLSLFFLSVSQAEEVVIRCDFTPLAKRYVYTLCEYTHALLLMQLGRVQEALGVAKAALPWAPPHDVRQLLCDVIVCCCTALEDSATLLTTSLSPHNTLYLALSRAFFGSLPADGFRGPSSSTVFKYLYPSQLPPYASVRQVLPYHMNRAVYMCNKGRWRDAWDETCCAVAATDEIVGSLEFAFTDCSPLRVYYTACQIGVWLLEALLSEEMETEKQCTASKMTKDEREKLIQTNSALGVEVLQLCKLWARQLLAFYPHVHLGEVVDTQVANIACGSWSLSRATMLSRRYPKSILARNTLTMAMYYHHRIPEAVDTAQKNLQDFPHSREVIQVQKLVQSKGNVYTFNYRTIVPLRYAPSSRERTFHWRMVIAMVLLAVNTAIVCLTAVANAHAYIELSERMEEVAVRLQLPSLGPLYFFVVVLCCAVLSAATPINLIRTLLRDLYFCDTALNRFLFCMRGTVLVNVVNALQITFAGNGFLIENIVATGILYFVLTVLFVPFTTRVWFLSSIDEPDVGILSWLTVLSVDTVAAFLFLIPHILLVTVEPLMFVLFFFFRPAERLSDDAIDADVHERLVYHDKYRHAMPGRFALGSGSRFIYIRLMALLYYHTHSSMTTRNLLEAQLVEEEYRLFPLVQADMLGHIRSEPLCTDTQLEILFPQEASTETTPKAKEGPQKRDSCSSCTRTSDNASPESRSDSVSCVRPLSRKTSRFAVGETETFDLTLVGGGNRMVETMCEGFMHVENATAPTERPRSFVRQALSFRSLKLSKSKQPLPRMRSFAVSVEDTSLLLADEMQVDGYSNVSLCDFQHDRLATEMQPPTHSRGEGEESGRRQLEKSVPTITESLELSLSLLEKKKAPTRKAPELQKQPLLPLSRSLSSSNELVKHSVPPDWASNVMRHRSPRADGKRQNSEKHIDSQIDVRGPDASTRSLVLLAADTDTKDQHSLIDLLRHYQQTLLTSPNTGGPISRAALLSTDEALLLQCLSHSNVLKGSVDATIPRLTGDVALSVIEQRDILSTSKDSQALELLHILWQAAMQGGVDMAGELIQRQLLVRVIQREDTELLILLLRPELGVLDRMTLDEWAELLRDGFTPTSTAYSLVEPLSVVLKALTVVKNREPLVSLQAVVQQIAGIALCHDSRWMADGKLRALVELLSRYPLFPNALGDGVEDPKDQQTLFSRACRDGELPLVQLLLTNNFVRDPNRVQTDGTNALQQAVLQDRLEVVQWLCTEAAHALAPSFCYSQPGKGTALEQGRRALRNLHLLDAVEEAMNRLRQQ